MKNRQKAEYTVTEERTLWLHVVVTTDGPNTTVYFTHVAELDIPSSPASGSRSRATAISGGSDWELVASPNAPKAAITPKPREAAKTPQQTWHIKVNLAAIGISFVDRRPREVCKRLKLGWS